MYYIRSTFFWTWFTLKVVFGAIRGKIVELATGRNPLYPPDEEE